MATNIRFRIRFYQSRYDCCTERRHRSTAKSVSLYDNRSVYGEIVARLLEEMLKAGYIDIVNEDRQEYIVLCTITYLEDIVNLIITDEDIASDEIPE